MPMPPELGRGHACTASSYVQCRACRCMDALVLLACVLARAPSCRSIGGLMMHAAHRCLNLLICAAGGSARDSCSTHPVLCNPDTSAQPQVGAQGLHPLCGLMLALAQVRVVVVQ